MMVLIESWISFWITMNAQRDDEVSLYSCNYTRVVLSMTKTGYSLLYFLKLHKSV